MHVQAGQLKSKQSKMKSEIFEEDSKIEENFEKKDFEKTLNDIKTYSYNGLQNG